MLKTLIVLSLFIVSPVLLASTFKVVIDPGHGGTDAGAVGKQNSNKIKESDITLSISKRVAQQLKKETSIETVLTRTNDSSINLSQRSKIAKDAKANLFISIHANSSTDSSARGAEVYFQSQMPPDEESLFLANRENEGHVHEVLNEEPLSGDLAVIIDDVKRSQYAYDSQLFAETLISFWQKDLRLRHNPIKQGPFHVLVSVPMPSVLVEIGFVSNRRELAKLLDSAYQNKIAEVISKGIKNYKEKMDKSEFSSHIISHRR